MGGLSQSARARCRRRVPVFAQTGLAGMSYIQRSQSITSQIYSCKIFHPRRVISCLLIRGDLSLTTARLPGRPLRPLSSAQRSATLASAKIFNTKLIMTARSVRRGVGPSGSAAGARSVVSVAAATAGAATLLLLLLFVGSARAQDTPSIDTCPAAKWKVGWGLCWHGWSGGAHRGRGGFCWWCRERRCWASAGGRAQLRQLSFSRPFLSTAALLPTPHLSLAPYHHFPCYNT